MKAIKLHGWMVQCPARKLRDLYWNYVKHEWTKPCRNCIYLSFEHLMLDAKSYCWKKSFIKAVTVTVSMGRRK